MKFTTLRAVTVGSTVAALLVAASPAWSRDDHRHGERERFEHRHERHYRPVIIQRVQPVYGYAPQRVYYAPPPVYVPAPVYYQPAPVYYSQPAPVYYSEPAYYEAPRVSNSALGTIGGAVIGAAIGNSVGRGNGHTAAIAIGAVTGAVIGGQIAR